MPEYFFSVMITGVTLERSHFDPDQVYDSKINKLFILIHFPLCVMVENVIVVVHFLFGGKVLTFASCY